MLSIAAASANEGGGTIGFPVTLSLTSEVQITVDYTTTAGTATVGSDFTDTDGTLTFAPGVRSRTILVSVIPDTADEDDETFTVTLSDPDAAEDGEQYPDPGESNVGTGHDRRRRWCAAAVDRRRERREKVTRPSTSRFRLAPRAPRT